MLRTRVIPSLLLKGGSLVKTVKFKKYNYIGDPVNTVRIFNELEVDELMFLDIFASRKKSDINFQLLKDIANECFMPLSYGGGIHNFNDAKKIFEIGFEKIVINSAAYTDLKLVKQLAKHFGSQSIIGSIDIKMNIFGKEITYSHHGKTKQSIKPIEQAQRLVDSGVGELLVTSIDHEGMWNGYQINLIRQISDAVDVPVIANGGAGSINDLGKAVKQGHASAVAVGSLVVYQKKGMGVLVNFPGQNDFKSVFKSN